MYVEKIDFMEEIGAQARNKYMQKRIGIEKLVLQHVRDFFPLLFYFRALRKGIRRSSGIFFADKPHSYGTSSAHDLRLSALAVDKVFRFTIYFQRDSWDGA